jgi:hypothetical protein
MAPMAAWSWRARPRGLQHADYSARANDERTRANKRSGGGRQTYHGCRARGGKRDI